jgi:hypothetical protein
VTRFSKKCQKREEKRKGVDNVFSVDQCPNGLTPFSFTPPKTHLPANCANVAKKSLVLIAHKCDFKRRQKKGKKTKKTLTRSHYGV